MQAMRPWLADALGSCALTSEVEDYLLGRGAKIESYRSVAATTWQVASSDCPDPGFTQRYGPRGQSLRGCLVIPFLCPRGQLMGFEARRCTKKWITDYRLMPDSRRVPIWLGLTPESMQKIWTGGNVWVTEGIFDKFAMEWVIPERDVALSSVRSVLSHSHIQFLKRYASYVHIVYDEDESGRKGAEKARKSLSYLGVGCRVIRYSGGKDPGEIWDKCGELGLAFTFRSVL